MHPSPGEIGGVVAAAVALLGALGAGLKWLLTFLAGRDASRSAKLQVWHDELDAREKEFERLQAEQHRKIEQRLEQVEGANRTLLRAVEMLSAALRVSDPSNPAIQRVEALLKQAFPADPELPPDMVAQLRQSRPRRGKGASA